MFYLLITGQAVHSLMKPSPHPAPRLHALSILRLSVLHVDHGYCFGRTVACPELIHVAASSMPTHSWCLTSMSRRHGVGAGPSGSQLSGGRCPRTTVEPNADAQAGLPW